MMSGVKIAENLIGQPDYITTAQELIDNEITEIPWLWDRFIPKRGLTFVSGSSDTGKSTFLRQLSLAIVAGEVEHLGRDISATHRSVIYVSTEDDVLSLSPRIKREKDYFISGIRYENLRFIFDNEDILRKLRAEIERQPADCIILDAFGDFFDGDINSSSSTRSFMNDYKAFSDEAGCAIVFLHHNRKASASGNPDKNDLLGSMAIEAKGRSVLMLSQSDSRSDRRLLRVVKGNYLTPEEKRITYDLSFEDGIFDIASTSVPYVSTSTREETRKLASEYKKKGKSIRDTTYLLNEQGYKVSKSSVGRMLKG